MDPLLDVSRVYSIMYQEETQCLLHLPLPTSDVVVMHVNRAQSYSTHDLKGKGNTTIIYKHCGKVSHSQSSYSRLNGFPVHSNQNRNTSRKDPVRLPMAHQVFAGLPTTSTKHAIPSLTNEQYHQLTDLLHLLLSILLVLLFLLFIIRLMFLILIG